jgi:hypothetical protein
MIVKTPLWLVKILFSGTSAATPEEIAVAAKTIFINVVATRGKTNPRSPPRPEALRN